MLTCFTFFSPLKETKIFNKTP